MCIEIYVTRRVENYPRHCPLKPPPMVFFVLSVCVPHIDIVNNTKSQRDKTHFRCHSDFFMFCYGKQKGRGSPVMSKPQNSRVRKAIESPLITPKYLTHSKIRFFLLRKTQILRGS